MVSREGFRHASGRLQLIDQKTAEAKTFDELKDAQRFGDAS